MNMLIVYASQFGNSERIARAMGEALSLGSTVQVLRADEATGLPGEGCHLLLVGAPTQLFGHRHLARAFLADLARGGRHGLPAAAFDTRMGTPTQKNAAESEYIATRLAEAGCRLAGPPESFLVAGLTGPLAPGEEERARRWALKVAERVALAPA